MYQTVRDVVWDVVSDFANLSNEVEDVCEALKSAKEEITFRYGRRWQRPRSNTSQRTTQPPWTNMSMDHPDYFRQQRLSIETVLRFLIDGFAGGLIASFLSAWGLQWNRHAGREVVSMTRRAWTIGRRAGWLLLNVWYPYKASFSLVKDARHDLNRHYVRTLNAPPLILGGLLYIVGFLLSRTFLWPVLMNLGIRCIALLDYRPAWQPDAIFTIAMTQSMGAVAAIGLQMLKILLTYIFKSTLIQEALRGIFMFILLDRPTVVRLLGLRYALSRTEGNLFDYLRSYINFGPSAAVWLGLWISSLMGSDYGRVVSPIDNITKSCAYGINRLQEMSVWKSRYNLSESFISSPSLQINREAARDRIYPLITGRRTIRLLKLQPHPAGGGILCTLENHCIDDAPSYWALSYVWGAPEFSFVLHLDVSGRTEFLPITESCRKALVALTPLKSVRYVWIDAVCINQTDRHEKAQQIPLMTDIYSQAEFVIGHLGDGVSTPWGKLPLGDFVRCLVQSDRVGLSWNISPKDTLQSGDRNITLLRKGSFQSFGAAHDVANWEAMIAIVDHPYWRRAWIVQEVVLAKELIFCYGDNCFTYKELAEISRLVSAFPLNPEATTCYEKAVLRLKTFSNTIAGIDVLKKNVELIRAGSPDSQNLAQVIDTLKAPIEATQPRDQIYAMLALSGDASEAALKPNYDPSMTDNELFVKVAAHYLQRGSCLNFFYIAGIAYRPARIKDLPSWTPSLSTPCHKRKRFWAASQPGVSIEGIKFRAGGRVLQMTGCCIDTLRVVSSASQTQLRKWLDEELTIDGRGRPAGVEDILENSREIFRSYVVNPYPGGKSKDEVYWRAMTFDRDLKGSPASPASETVFEQALAWMTSEESDEERKDNEFFTAQKLKRQLQRTDSIMQYLVLWAEYVFSVSAAGYIAWVPPQAQVGDVLFLASDTDVAFLLRKSSIKNCYEYVGEAYLYESKVLWNMNAAPQPVYII